MKRVERILQQLTPNQKSYLSSALKVFAPRMHHTYTILLHASERKATSIPWAYFERVIVRLLDWYLHPTDRPPQIEELLRHIRILLSFHLYRDAEKVIKRAWKQLYETESWHYGFPLLEYQKQLYHHYDRIKGFKSIFPQQHQLYRIVHHLSFLQRTSWILEKWWIHGGIILRSSKRREKVKRWLQHPIFQNPLPVHTPNFLITHYNTKGMLLLFNASPESAYECFLKAYSIAKEHKKSTYLLISLINAIGTHTFLQNYQQAVVLLKLVLENWDSTLIRIPLYRHALLANTLHLTSKYGNHSLVKAIYIQSKTLMEGFSHSSPYLSSVYQNLAVIAASLEWYSEAFSYSEKSIEHLQRSYHLPFLLLFQTILAYEMKEWSLLESRLRKVYRILLSQENPLPLERFLLDAIRKIWQNGMSSDLLSTLERDLTTLLQQHPYDAYYLRSTQFPFQEWLIAKKENGSLASFLHARESRSDLEEVTHRLLEKMAQTGDFEEGPEKP